jgi:ABC-type molybdate transport system permease subunit
VGARWLQASAQSLHHSLLLLLLLLLLPVLLHQRQHRMQGLQESLLAVCLVLQPAC